MAEKEPILARCRRLEESHGALWRAYHDAQTEEEKFLGGERYEEDSRSYNKDRRYVQIRGQEVQDTIRHIAAKVTERPRNLEARPRDHVDDPDNGEAAVAIMEWELGNLWKGFDDVFEEAIIASREMRLGVVWMDWDPDCGPYGEILFRYVDPRNIAWDPAYNPHHPNCGWVRESKRLDVAQARKTYKAPWLMPDRDLYRDGQVKAGVPLIRGVTDNPEFTRGADDNKVTLWFWWFKNEGEAKDAPVELNRRLLPPDKRYMACPLCSYRSRTQGAMAATGDYKGDLPEAMPCPVCEGNGKTSDLRRIDAISESAEVLAYANGHRLVIQAPYCANPKGDLPVDDSTWPIPTARSFPGLFLTAYVKPGRPMGPSDTTLMWDQQIAADNLRTMAIQRIYEHRTIWKQSRKGWYDGNGRRFEHRDDQSFIAYGDATDAEFGALFMDPVTGEGLDPEFNNVMQITLNALTQYRGVADLGLTQESSKDIAASSLAQMNQMGEVPTAHFDRRKHREVSKFCGVLWDYIRGTYTPDKIARLRMDDVDIAAALHGDDLPDYDFQVSDTPPWTGLDKARADAFQPLMAIAQSAPDMVEVWGELNNIPKSTIRKVMKVMQARQEEAAQAAQQQAAGGGLPNPPGAPQGASAGAPPAAPHMPEPGAGLTVPAPQGVE